MFTGILTGSVYDDVDLKRNGFPGEALSDNSVLVIKTHDVTPQLYEQAVLLVRHPAGTLLAEYNRRHHGHVGMDPAITFDTNPGTLWGSFKGTPSIPETYLLSSVAWGLNLRVG